jgi:UDP:flavonoid glycosyltransferase YjiC (YdhE family)
MEGVFAPMVPLVTALRRDGHDVLVVTGADLVDRVREAGFPALALGPTAEDAAAQARRDPEFAAGDEPWRLGATMFARVMAPRKLPALQRLIEDFAPDLVVQAPVDLAAPLAAAGHGIPALTYGTGLVLEPALMSAMAGWVSPLWEQAGLQLDAHAGMYRHGYLNPVPATLQPDLGPAAAVARPIRPYVPGSPADELPDRVDGLGGRPVLYVSLGTVPVFNRPDVFTILLEAVADLDADVLVTVGRNNDPAAFRPAPNVRVERWLSLRAILPVCSAVVCHAGAGTTLAALAHGLPLVLLPRGADQFPTAAAGRGAGAAEVVTPDRLTAQAVRQAVLTILAGDSHRRAAARLGQEIAAMPSAEEIARDLAVHAPATGSASGIRRP